jgi:hypothetical protein
MLDHLLMKVLLRESVDGVGHKSQRLKFLSESLEAICLKEFLGCDLGKPKTDSQLVLAKPLSDRKCTIA